MRTSTFRATALLCVLVSAVIPPAARAEDDTATAILKSAGAKGGEIAAKALAGLLYDTSCKGVNLDQTTGYICKILGSVSGRAEDEWKAKVEEQLGQISKRLETIENGQRAIQKELTTQHRVMEAEFNQVSTNVVAGTHLVRIEGLWEKYQAQFDKVDADVTRDSMISFAKEIMKSEPHTILADLNVVLTKPILDGQPLLRYPFYKWGLKNNSVMVDKFNAAEIYDFSERKFVDFRTRQQKGYVMYLWAATVLESQCKLKPEQCTDPPRSTKDFQADFDRYTRQQTEAFNAAVDWLLLSYASTRVSSAASFLPSGSTGILLRANFLTASMLSSNEGLWGRVISMGNAWDGSLQVTCGGASQTLTPVLKYSTPVGGSGGFYSGPDSGPLDWWVSSQGNATYDEVRFADNWQIYHYNFAAAKAGPCTVSQSLPKGGALPWIQPGTNVENVKTFDGRSFPFGSFVAIQRAGGTYALVSGGNWEGTMTPERGEDGNGERKDVVYEWFVEPDHPSGPWVGLLMKGRGEYAVLRGSSRIHNRNKIQIRQAKAIRFPDDRTVKLNYFPGNCKGELCNYGNASTILNYDIENNDTESKKGKMVNAVAVYFDKGGTIDARGLGVLVDGSYDKTGDKKTINVEGPQIGIVNTEPGKGYRLTYLVYFDLETEGRYTNATEYMYRGLLAPGSMYLTK